MQKIDKITPAQKKILTDKRWKLISFIASCFLSLIFITILVFIIISAIPGFQEFGLDGILGTLEFNLTNGKASLWSPLAITLLVTIGAVILATPIGIKTATFIKFRLKEKQQKFAFIVVQALSGIPSVVFGLFALQSLGKVVGLVFGLSNAYNIINAIIMLTFMILPTIITLTLNTYNSISLEFIENPISLGLTRTRSIYKVYKLKARNGVIVAVIIAIGRAFGETMALSMILTNESFGIISEGLIGVLTSGLGTLGSLIATNMFSETGGPATRGVLYAFGIFLFILIMLLNAVILHVTKDKRNKNLRIAKVQMIIGNIVMWVPHTISSFISDLYLGKKINYNYRDNNNLSKFIKARITHNNLSEVRTWWWIIWETLCAFLTFGFLLWICFDIIIGGLNMMFGSAYSTAFSYGVDTTGQALINTLIIILVSLIISIPFSLLIAIYLNEYAHNGKTKRTILFFVDCLGSSPSIIFGMFGLAVFIELFGIALGGSMGKSLLAGALTISIVILPSLIRMSQQALEGVPISVREGAYSLGCTKWETIWKVVMRQALKPLISSVILSIGRIMAETAPLYLTAGLTSVSGVGLMLPGQTLTTRIYAQLSSNDLASFNAITYECAFIALSIIILLICLGNFVIPNAKKIKETVINAYFTVIFSIVYINNDKKLLKTIKPQIIKNVVYLTYDQAIALKIDYHHFKFFFHHRKLYYIKYVNLETLSALSNEVFVDKY